MLRIFVFLTFLLSFAIAANADAQRKSDFRDSLDFLADDGEMTPDEMEEEAMGIYNRCVADPIKTTHYDCECVAAEFLAEREKVGPYELQYNLLLIVYTKTPKCINAAEIAGANYQDCQMSSEIMRRGETNNEEYCECIARRSAIEFALMPSLRNRVIQHTRANAISHCMAQHPSSNLIKDYRVRN